MLFGDNKKEALEAEMADVVMTEAADLDIINERGEIFDSGEKILLEANFATEIKKIKVTKNQKISKLVQRTAMEVARRKIDPNWQKWRFHRQKAEEFRLKIEQKYAATAKKLARQIITVSKSGKGEVQWPDLPQSAGTEKT